MTPVSMDTKVSVGQPAKGETVESDCRAACPVCGGKLFEIRAKLQCAQCHTICETCCEGGRG
ncbi:MAG: hypothetical protein EHM42_04225 [Planctomycetaceae bacterium]|nr:MAG: hypothetical protein EHM42_04225 [Planctomycetaceae bacterium]